MTTVNSGAVFTGSGALATDAPARKAAGVTFFAAGALRVANTQKFTLQAGGQVLAGKGLLDSWRVSNFAEYDPAALYGRNMRLRKARLSSEGILGDD